MSDTTILVVDDSKLSRMMICDIVKRFDPSWTIVEASGGEEALAAVEGKQIDKMTLDLNMPGMDGMTLAKALRKQYPSAAITLLTANVQDAVRRRVAAANIGFIPKPITEEKLLPFLRGEMD